MGCTQSRMDDGGEQSKVIDKQLERDKQLKSKTTTIFLAGTGESGKSTVVKQLRLKYSDPYATNERLEYRSVILSNLVQSMMVILEAMPDLGVEFVSTEEEHWSKLVLDLPPMIDSLPQEAVSAITSLWRSKAVRECMTHSSKFQLNDSAPYFFENVQRFTVQNFVPTDDDILRARVRTTGIIEERFQVKDRIYKVLDVGGQRSERRKWISCFENVDVLLFLFATQEFDMMLYEDETQNRFVEAENLFGSISNSLWFRKSTLIVFFNKIDLFALKLQTVMLRDHLPEFAGPNTPESGLKYIQNRVMSLYHGAKPPYSHFTCATDTRGINVILSAVQDQINEDILKTAYMV
ncbi:G protein alpha subunit [Meredithblackwellia eburnea MCA 4105]